MYVKIPTPSPTSSKFANQIMYRLESLTRRTCGLKMARSRSSGARATRTPPEGEILLQEYVLADSSIAALDTPSTETTCLAGRAILSSAPSMPDVAMPCARSSGLRPQRRQ